MSNDNDPLPLTSFPLTIGIAYNLKKGIISEVEDFEAEYDSLDTIYAIKNVFMEEGINVKLLEADTNFIENLKKAGVDIVFNIAEGTNGRGRESHVPAILNFLGIPFTGSDETTLGLALDKALTKRYLSTYNIDTPAYKLINSIDFKFDSSLSFPLIVKPNHEGSGKGISKLAIVDSKEQLVNIINRNFRLYDQPLLVEQFIKGREFTVGILGNQSDIKVFEPMEILYLHKERENRIYSYDVKTNYKKYVKYSCPPSLDKQNIIRMKETAVNIYNALECRDFSRIDFMLSEDGTIYFIEINPLPGLTPGYSDYPMLAEFCGMDYKSLLFNVLNSALKRYGLKEVLWNRGEINVYTA